MKQKPCNFWARRTCILRSPWSIITIIKCNGLANLWDLVINHIWSKCFHRNSAHQIIKWISCLIMYFFPFRIEFFYFLFYLNKNCCIMIQIQFPSGSNGGRIGATNVGDLSLAATSNGSSQWQSNFPPQIFAAAAASSGFPQQIVRPQNWSSENGFHHSLMRPSWPCYTPLHDLPFFSLWFCKLICKE